LKNFTGIDSAYLRLLWKVLNSGELIQSRNSEVVALTNTHIKADCSNHKMPIVSLKKTNYKSAITELIWFLKGDTNIKYLNDRGIHIWDQWADKEGNLGKIYGYQWAFQIENVLFELKENPFSRRLMVNSWNYSELDDMNLPPCHYNWQLLCYENDNGTIDLDMVVSMRSSDLFVGLPFNLVNYGTLLHLISHHVGYNARNLHINMASAHIYCSHIETVKTLLDRSITPYKQSTITLLHDASLSLPELVPETIVINGYESGKFLKVNVYK